MSGKMKKSTSAARTGATIETQEEPTISLGLGFIKPNPLEASNNLDTLERSPSKQKSPSRKRTKSLGNILLRSQADKELVPPRPPNAWILYRSIKFKEFKAKKFPSPMLVTPPLSASPASTVSSSNTHPGLQAEVSRIVSDMWKAEKEEVKLSYMKMAEEKKNQHMQMFPDYKYRPKRQYGSSSAKIKAGEEGITTSSTDSNKELNLKPAKRKPKAISRAHTFTIDTSLPPTDITSVDDSKKYSTALLDSPILSAYATVFSSIFDKRAPSPMLEESEDAVNVKAQMVKEMHKNDWLRAIASSTEANIESTSATSFNFDQTVIDERYAIPPWGAQSPRIPSSASAPARHVWETAPAAPVVIAEPSSASSWHTADQQLPWDCTDLIETLDDFASDLCTSNLSTTPDYSSTSSPYHYVNTNAASDTSSPSSLHLGIAATANGQSQDSLPSPFIFNEEQNLVTSVSIHSDYQDAYFPRHQEAAAPLPVASSTFQEIQALWPHLASQMQKSASTRPSMPSQTAVKAAPYQQHQHYASSDGGHHGINLHWQSQPLQTSAQFTPLPQHHHDVYNTDPSKVDYTSSQHHHQTFSHHQHYPGIQQQGGSNQQQQQYQHNTSNVPWEEDYRTHQELIHQLHRLAQEDVSKVQS